MRKIEREMQEIGKSDEEKYRLEKEREKVDARDREKVDEREVERDRQGG